MTSSVARHAEFGVRSELETDLGSDPHRSDTAPAVRVGLAEFWYLAEHVTGTPVRLDGRRQTVRCSVMTRCPSECRRSVISSVSSTTPELVL